MTQPYGTARLYAFIGFIFYAIAAAAGVIMLIVIAFFFAAATSTSVPTGPGAAIVFPFFGVFSLVFLVLLIPAIVLLFFAWQTVKSIDLGRYGQARTYSLILGIVGLIFGILLGGIFFLLAYARLGEAPVLYAPQPPPAGPQRFCVYCGRPVPLDSKFCPNCGRELPP